LMGIKLTMDRYPLIMIQTHLTTLHT